MSRRALFRRKKQIEKSDFVGSRTRNLPACSTEPQPTALPRARLELQESRTKYVEHEIYLSGQSSRVPHFSLINIETVTRELRLKRAK
jgi:hypothetical protein